jgi:threonylcarbamoyladenosine tRNA methylthiotransferase MtaB
MAKTLKTVTLGCKVNQYETEFVRQGFEQLGYRKASEGEAVDLCIVNSCTVTAESEAKSRKIIRRLAKAHPEAEIIVMGCFATRAPDEAAALPGVVDVIADKRELPNLLACRGLVDIPAGIARFSNRRRAYVKVQDGCRMKCSYCIVPTVRPHLMSRPVDEVLDEVRRLLADGHREIVLTGIHLFLLRLSPLTLSQPSLSPLPSPLFPSFCGKSRTWTAISASGSPASRRRRSRRS